MEKNKNISLDELFARAKGEEPVISQEDVRAIVSSATSPVQSVQQTTSFISRKGFIMTGLGLVGATAALVGYLTMGSGQLPGGSGQWSVASGELGNGKIETVTPTVEPKKENKEPKEVKKEVVVKIGGNGGGMKILVEDDGTPTPKFDGPHIPDGKLMAPLEVERVGIIQANEKDLPKLGLSKAPNGDILFKASENGGRGMTIAIPAKGWGVKTNIVSGKDAETNVKLSPMIITDERGNRRFVNYSDSNTWVHMQRFNSDMPGGVIIDGNDVPNIHISNDEVNFVANNDSNVYIKEVKTRYSVRKNVTVTPDKLPTANVIDPQRMKAKLKINISDKSDKDSIVEVNLDLDALNAALFKFDDSLNGLRVDLDSMRHSLFNVEVENEFYFNSNSSNSDSTTKNINKLMNGMLVIDQNFSPEEAEIFDQNIGHGLENLDKELESLAELLSEKINTLVPVLVRKATEVTRNKEENRDYDNGVIMWFEPEYYYKQIEKASGTNQSVQNGTPSSSSVISNTTVYPNPVRLTKTNIHYKLSEPRSVAFSVHDILGKKIVDCGSLAERPQGEYDFELNIGNIPAGIYLVVITTDKGEQTIQRIAVEK